MIAEVLREADEDGWAYRLVRGCELLSELPGKSLTPVALKTDTKRKRSTIARDRAERLLWSDESARSSLESRFLGNRKPVPLLPKGGGGGKRGN